jgi:hypothetical protein
VAAQVAVSPLRATVSGSFTRAIDEVGRAVLELTARGVEVLSPKDPRPVDRMQDFVFVASDTMRTVRVLQERHFAAIDDSDLLWLCIVDGQLGDSVAAEVHHANLAGVPVFTTAVPDSLYWRQVVQTVQSLAQALSIVASSQTSPRELLKFAAPAFLLHPEAAAEIVHCATESLCRRLTGRRTATADDQEVWNLLGQIRSATTPPTRP